MVVATDGKMNIENNIEIDTKDTIILTDNYCSIDTIIPKIY